MVAVAGRKSLCAAMLVLLVAAVTAPANAADPATLGLQKRGEGRLSFFGISLYKASLWTETVTGTPDPDSESVLLQIDYERNIKRERILKITRKEWRRLDVADRDQQQVWLDKLAALLPDVQPGDQLSSLTVPGAGTRFYFANEPIGYVEDPEFSAAFLAIWLDPRTRAAALREKLIADRSAAAQLQVALR